MTVKLNNSGFEQAKNLVDEGAVALDDRDDWSEHQPSTEQENRYIEEHGLAAFGRWHHGIDVAGNEDTRDHYKFPYGDFDKIHRCAVLAAESRAAQHYSADIQPAAAPLPQAG